MFFFKRNNEQIQEIQHMLEKCNLNIKDLSETLDLNEKDVNRAMSGSIKQKDLLDKIQNYLLDLLKTRESETRNELAKKSLAELHFLLDYAKENSDSKYDQQIKMKVSEQLQQDIYKIVKNTKKVEEAREKITNNLDNIDKSIKQVLINENYPLDYKINYGDNYFPAKEYKKIKYEAGYYESVLVTLGEGKGKNWWCVLFPPLCLIEAEESDDVEYKFFVKELLDKYLK